MRGKIIGFNGQMGSGKSTAVETLKFLLDGKQKVHLVKFAQPLYDMQEFIYRRISSVYERPEDFIKDRKLLQWLGTDWGREKDQSLWVKLWAAEAEKKAGEGYIVVCDDVRFDNEALAIHKLNGDVVQIVRPDSFSKADGGIGLGKAHASEQGIDPTLIDYTVQNTTSKSNYQDRLTTLFSQILSLNNEAK